MGMWLPVHGEQWDGDVPLGLERGPNLHHDTEKGTITFKGNTLPWLVGRYEVISFNAYCDPDHNAYVLGSLSP